MQDETLTETLSLIDEETEGLPEGWRLVRLGDICQIKGGKRLPAGTDFSTTKTDFPYIRVTDLIKGKIRLTQLKYLDAETQKQISRYIINKDDVYISIAGSIGFVGTIPDELDGANLTENAARLIIDREIVERDFLSFYLQSVEGQQQIKKRTNLVGQPKLALERIATIQIPIPPTIEQQRRIASVLDEQMKAVEQARLAVEEQLKAANLLPNAFLRVVFESEEAQNWQKRKLGDVCESYTENKDPRKTPETLFNYVDISSVDNVNKRIVESRKILGKDAPSRARQVISTNDIIVATTRPNLNAVAVVPEKLNDEICSTGFCVLRPTEKITSDFLFAFVQSPSFVEPLSDLVKGALYPAVTDKQVKQQTIPLPTIEEQRKFAEKINEQMQAAETLKKSLTEKLEAVKKLPAALLRKAFAGEI